MASCSEAKMIVLISSDDHTFHVPEAAALMSETIKNMVEDDCAADGIPLPNVDSKTLVKVIEFCKAHAAADDTRKDFDHKFMESIDNSMLFHLILGANYLNIKELLELTCQTVADMIKEKSVEEVRSLFNIDNDFSPEEEAAVRNENLWAFDI